MTLTKKYKIVLLGDSRCGKTALLHRFLSDDYSSKYQPTLGSDLHTRTVTFQRRTRDTEQQNKLRLQFWDTSGDPRFRDSIPFQDAAVALVVYDTSNLQSFQSACDYWIPRVREFQPNCLVILVGNQVDRRQRGRHQAEIPAPLYKSIQGVVQVSARAGYNVRSLFELTVSLMMGNHEMLDGLSQRSSTESSHH